MDISGDRDPVKQSPTSKQAKRCVQSKLPWAVSPRLNGVSAHSPPLSPSTVVKFVEKGPKSSVERKCQGRKRNSRMKSLDKAFEEESLRFNARKQAHSCSFLHKATKRPTEGSKYCTGMMSSCPDLYGDYGDLFPPVHVFEALNDDVVMPDWRNWKFLVTNSVNLSSHSSLENFSSLFEDSVEPLKMESACMKEEDLDLLLLACKTRDSTLGVTTSSKLSSVLASKEHLSSPLKTVHVGSNSSLPPACISCVDHLGQNGLHKRRLASYRQRNNCFPDCDLWTDKYRPENGLEVCGNAESVKFLSEWLKSWYETGNGKKCFAVEDNDGASYNSDHRMDKTYGCNTLKNALLITGPVGVGKSSAVYACARELGFKVIEINASSLRNGAYLRQTFGEAVDSLGLLHWLLDDQLHQTSKPMQELLLALPDVANNEFQVDTNEMGSKKCHEINATGKRNAPSQVANKTLLLFEEVDIVFNDDHGFISTILKLAEITKRPIILTSNKRKSFLPQLLNRLTVLEFKAPSYQELLCHASMVCTFEKVCVSFNLLEHIVYACLCDIRRVLMLLQFWCQGKRYDTDRRIHCTKISVPFDIDAAHFALPKIIPWDFHCELSEKLENEICRTISTVNQNDSLVGIALQHTISSKGNFDPWEMNSCVNGQQSLHKEFPNRIDNLEILFDDSYSPLSSSQRLFQQKHDIALSSPSNVLATSPITLTPPTHEFHGVLPIAGIENSFNSFEEASISRVCDTYDIHDVSCVPQSSLVSEDETIMTSYLLSGAVSHKQDLPSFLSPNRYTSICPEVHLTNSDEGILEASKFSRNTAFYLESIQGNEDLVGFENELKYESSHFQLINDECSRAGFNIWSALKERFVYTQEVASVPEAWRKFRSSRAEYKSLLSANSKHASSVASVTSKVADLISEMDFMHQSCSSALCESLDPTATFRVEYGSKSCYDSQIDMGFTFAQHGFCFYMMKCAAFGSWLGRNGTAHVSEEILASSTNSISLGMLLTHENCTGHISSLKPLDAKTPQACMLIEREPVAVPVDELYDIILRVVPIRLSMVLKGHAFHEYLSFLMHISRLVASLPVESWEHKSKRKTSLHHLSSCARHFTSEQMEFLARRSRSCSSGSSIL